MKAWSAYLPDILPEVTGAPTELVEHYVRNTVIDFCESTCIWMEIWDPFPIGGGLAVYEFDVEPKTLVHKVLAAELANGNDIAVRTPGFCDENFAGWRSGTVKGAPCVLTQVNPKEYILVPAPSTNDTITLTVALKPTRDATQGPDVLFDEFYEGICAGAKARLMLMKDKAWSDPQQGAAYGAFFNEKVEDGNKRRIRAFGNAVSRVQGHYF